MYIKNGKTTKSLRFDIDDVESFIKKYGSELLLPFFRQCLKKSIDKNGFDFVQSMLFGDNLDFDKNYRS